MKDEYDLLNSVDMDFSEYEIEHVSEFEKKKLIKQFRKEKNKKTIWNKKKSMLCAMVLLFIVFISGYGKESLVAANSLMYNIDSWLGISNDEYSNQLGKTLKVKDTIITVKELFISDSRIIFHINSNKDYNDSSKDLGGLNNMLEKLVPDVYVDGKKIERSSDFLGYAIDEYDDYNKNGDVIIEVECNSLVLDNKNNVKLVFSRLAKEINASEKLLTYSFEYDSTEYKNDTKEIKVDKSIIIDDSKLYVDNIVVRPDKVSISGCSEGFSRLDKEDMLNHYDVLDQDGNIMGVKEEIGQGAYFLRNNKDLKTISIVPYTFNKINTNRTSVTEDGRTKYIIEDKIINIDID